MNKFLLFAFLCFLASCATENRYKTLTSGQIGCAKTDIAVFDTTMSDWKATCKGKTFFCSVTGDSTISCKEELK